MNLKKFRAKTMGEALAAVKRALGPDGVILHTRTYTEGAVMGCGGRRMVEITATKDVSSLRMRPPRATLQRGEEQAAVARGAAPMTSVADTHDENAALSVLTRELAELREAVSGLSSKSSIVPSSGIPAKLRDAYQQLIEAQVTEGLSAQLVRRIRAEQSEVHLQNPAQVRDRLARYVASMLPTAEPAKLKSGAAPTVLALVGPTGVGKTTTAAKLAAQYRLRQGRKVGLITVDTYRIGAVDQLHTYADILAVPLEVVTTPAEMETAVRKMDTCDVIIIDTTGRSQNDTDRLKELKSLLDKAAPDETHLVLSSTTSTVVCRKIIERFDLLGVNRMIFTKLDEAVGFGVILNCLHQATSRLSYVTTGQEVPDDIEVGHGGRLADLIVQGHDVALNGNVNKAMAGAV